MRELSCAVAEQLFQPQSAPPLLSIVVPNKDRADELMLAVSSIYEQLTDGLEQKVEIIVCDNASGPEVAELLRAMSAQSTCVSYLIHQRDEMGLFQFFAAPWRARGRFTWVFGSDDVLLPGGVAAVVDALEKHDPHFLTMNKRAWTADLSAEVFERANSVPDRLFGSVQELFGALGVNQLAFISGNVERTETARRADWNVFLSADTRHPHVGGYIEKFWNLPSFYLAENRLVHRLGNSLLEDYHAGNFFDYAVGLPRLLIEVGERVGAPKGWFEQITGEKRITSYEPSALTFVDSIFENALRAMGSGLTMNVTHRHVLERALVDCRQDRMAQFAEIWAFNQSLVGMQRSSKEAAARFEQAKAASMQTSAVFAQAA